MLYTYVLIAIACNIFNFFGMINDQPSVKRNICFAWKRANEAKINETKLLRKLNETDQLMQNNSRSRRVRQCRINAETNHDILKIYENCT